MTPSRFFDRISRLDRRWIFLAILLAVALPFLTPLEFRAKPSEQTREFDRALDAALGTGKPIMVDVDFGPQTMAELEPLLLGVMHRIFESETKAIFFTLMPDAAAPTRQYLSEMAKEYGLEYGVDYVFLGYASSFAYTMYGMGTSIEKYFHEDDRGTPLGEIPIMKGVERLADVSAVVNMASNSFPKFWIQYGVAPFGFDLLVGCTAVNATDLYPYLQTGQLKGLLAGGRAGAEYEALLVEKGVVSQTGDATRGLGSQSLALIAILLFIVMGNAGYFLGRGARGPGRDERGGRP